MVIRAKSASMTLRLEINVNGEQSKEGNDPKFQGEGFLTVLTSRLPGVFGPFGSEKFPEPHEHEDYNLSL